MQRDRLSLNDFNSFLGIKRGDHLWKVRKIYGKTNKQSIEKRFFWWPRKGVVYYEPFHECRISFSFEPPFQRIWAIEIDLFLEEVSPDLEKDFAAFGFKDPKLRLLSKKKEEIGKLMERGHAPLTENGEHGLAYEERKSLVAFSCYGFNNWRCSEISVLWFWH